MLQSAIPAKFGLVWAQNAAGAYIRSIPQVSQQGITNGAASLNDGFPPDCFTVAGGVPPSGLDFNGILKQLSQWAQWQQAGAPVLYDATFSGLIGGYPKGAILQSSVTSGLQWYNTADNNTTNPDSSGAGWLPMGQSYSVPPGSMIPFPGASAPSGWLFAYGQLVSIATYPLLYAAYGTAYGSGSGTFGIPDMRGRSWFGLDNMGGTAAGRLTGADTGNIATPTVLGSTGGEENHTLLTAEMPSHTHTAAVTDPGHLHGIPGSTLGSGGDASINFPFPSGASIGNTATATTGISVTNANTGGGGSHNNIPPGMVGNWIVKT